MIIAIPSKARAGKIKTLSIFKNPNLVYIFVEPQDYNSYKIAYPNNKVIKLHENNRGIVYVRNFILDFFKGKSLIMLDDDITRFERVVGKDKLVDNFESAISRVEDLLKNYYIVTFHSRAFSNNITKAYSFNILARQIYGIKNDRSNMRFEEKSKFIEDYEFSAHCMIEKLGVIRINQWVYQTPTIGSNKGGCNINMGERRAQVEQSKRFILKRYPKLFEEKYNRSLGLYDLRLKRIRE